MKYLKILLYKKNWMIFVVNFLISQKFSPSAIASDLLMFTEWGRKSRRASKLWWANVARQALLALGLCGTKVWGAAAYECHTGWQTTAEGRLAGQVQRATATCRQSIQFIVVVVCCMNCCYDNCSHNKYSCCKGKNAYIIQ